MLTFYSSTVANLVKKYCVYHRTFLLLFFCNLYMVNKAGFWDGTGMHNPTEQG